MERTAISKISNKLKYVNGTINIKDVLKRGKQQAAKSCGVKSQKAMGLS